MLLTNVVGYLVEEDREAGLLPPLSEPSRGVTLRTGFRSTAAVLHGPCSSPLRADGRRVPTSVSGFADRGRRGSSAGDRIVHRKLEVGARAPDEPGVAGQIGRSNRYADPVHPATPSGEINGGLEGVRWQRDGQRVMPLSLWIKVDVLLLELLVGRRPARINVDIDAQP